MFKNHDVMIASNNNILTGSCSCQMLRYALSPKPIQSICCHCADCRNANNTPSTIWIDTEFDNFHLTNGQLVHRQRSQHTKRGYCPHCKTQITYDYQYHGIRDFGITQDSLDNSEGITLICHIWTSHKICHIDDNLPQYTQETPEFSLALERLNQEKS